MVQDWNQVVISQAQRHQLEGIFTFDRFESSGTQESSSNVTKFKSQNTRTSAWVLVTHRLKNYVRPTTHFKSHLGKQSLDHEYNKDPPLLDRFGTSPSLLGPIHLLLKKAYSKPIKMASLLRAMLPMGLAFGLGALAQADTKPSGGLQIFVDFAG